MARYVIPFLGCEGPNDRNFLLPMLRKVFAQAALDHNFELLDTFLTDDDVSYSAGCGLSFEAWVQATAQAAFEKGDGDAILCIHTDEDGDLAAAAGKIARAQQGLVAADSLTSAQVVAVIPARTIEAWMLVDAATLGQHLNPDLPPHQLGLAPNPESYPDAKVKLHLTHQLAHANRRRRQPARIELGELYEAMGTDLTIEQLRKVSSFQSFMDSLDAALTALNASY